MVVEVAPKVPLALLGLVPVPQRPGLDGRLVHEGHVESRVKGGGVTVMKPPVQPS